MFYSAAIFTGLFSPTVLIDSGKKNLLAVLNNYLISLQAFSQDFFHFAVSFDF